MTKVLTSILLTLTVSSFFGILFSSWIVFILATILQVLFFYFFNTLYENYLVKKVIETNASIEKEKYKNFVQVLCPCGENTSQNIVLSLNEDIIYNCSKCSKEVRATTNVGTSLVTTPILTKK